MTKHELFLLFKQDPQKALDHVLDEGERSLSKCAHLYRGCDVVGGGKAGSYRGVTRKTLEGRTYRIEFINDNVALFFTDVVYDMRTFQHIPKPQNKSQEVDHAQSGTGPQVRSTG